MSLGAGTLEQLLGEIDSAAGALARRPSRYPAADRFRADLSAARYHLRRPKGAVPIVAILGGTGTGKSTLLNRLLTGEIAATSFRRTFTAGAIAVTADPGNIPPDWLGVAHSPASSTDLPVRGRIDTLCIVTIAHELTQQITIIDTPDLDGDQPAHHAQADRVFRWADSVLFLVTPEKYQMTELLPYYRLAARYGLPALHVMNKVEEQAVVDDYANQAGAAVYAIPRDDAAYEPPTESNLDALRVQLRGLTVAERADGNIHRAADLMDRLRDQIIEPIRRDRREIDGLIRSLRAMATPAPGVDVNPLTQQLQRRLQQRSVLYLMGPGRVLDRVRQVPGMLARLPRTTWDLLRTGRLGANGSDEPAPDLSREHPNFHAAMVDQFNIVQSRIDELIRSSDGASRWLDDPSANYASSRLSADLAGQIADDEIAQLQHWLEQQWNAKPRDTAMIEKLLKLLPGGPALSKWSEAAPYLLAVVVATHHAFFGPIDLMILGGFSLATWLGEKLSNEVSSRARQANNAIAARFSDLVHRQIEQTCQWLDAQGPDDRAITRLEQLAERAGSQLEAAGAAP